MDVPPEISTIILSNAEPVDIGRLSSVNRTAVEYDAVWNAKLRKLDYPSVPCPQGFYFIVTTVKDRRALLAALINTGITAYLKSYLTIHDVNLISATNFKRVTDLSPEMADYIRPLLKNVRDASDYTWPLSYAIGNCLPLFDLLIEAIECDKRQKVIHYIKTTAANVMKALPIFAKYQLDIPMGNRLLQSYTDEDYVKALLVLPSMSSRDSYLDIPYSDYKPFLTDFEVAYAKDPIAYQPAMDIIRRVSEEKSDTGCLTDSRSCEEFTTPASAWEYRLPYNSDSNESDNTD